MKYLISILLALTVSFSAATAASAQETTASAQEKIRVLLTFGGHGFEQEPFFAMFDAMKDVEYTKAPMPASADLLKPDLKKKYDVIVMYDMVGDLSAEQHNAFVALLNEGIGLVSLHHNMGAHRNWDEFRKITGGKFIFEPCEIDGKKYTKSGWSHGEDMKVTVADKEHPITKGLKDFEIHDETYNKYYTAADAKVLLTTDHPKNDPKLAWVQDYGKSRVFYFMLGHDAKAWANPNFAEILGRGIRWTAGK
ncbi:MAG: ThuA domain-containing protein [Candidatus Nealsonbacteria bacterium]|nr:ThuA domain-containing protein [Candidatus Nealsonbacteria bacterium]